VISPLARCAHPAWIATCPLDEVPWNLLVACNRLVSEGNASVGRGADRGKFKRTQKMSLPPVTRYMPHDSLVSLEGRFNELLSTGDEGAWNCHRVRNHALPDALSPAA
jgi:hypothetical protein